MNIFARIFGKSQDKSMQNKSMQNKSKPNTIDVLSDLKHQLVILEKRAELLNNKIHICNANAKQKANTDKNGALIELKRKKKMEMEINNLQGIVLTIENQISSLESATINKYVISAIKNGKECIDNTNKEIDVDDVSDLFDEIEEQHEIANNISEIMSRPMKSLLEDDDILNELEILKAEESPKLVLPSVPTHILIQEKENIEINKLMESMSA